MRERWSTGAIEDDRWFQSREPRIADRIDRLVEDAMRRPVTGLGKPEPLRGPLAGWWSRRITGEHRLVYRVTGTGATQTLEIIQCRHHY